MEFQMEFKLRNTFMAAESLWRIGIAGDILMHVCDIPLMLVLYGLLRPVSEHLALLAILM